MIEFSIACKEGHRSVERHVRQMRPLPEDALFVFDHVGEGPNMFNTQEPQNDLLTALMLNAESFWLVDDVGLIFIGPMEGRAAHTHVTFWDKRLRGREALYCELARRVLTEYPYDTLWTVVPRKQSVVKAFAYRLGFMQHSTDAQREVLVAPAECFTMKQPALRS